MYMTRPYFRGYSVLSKIVDNENTIENIRAKKEQAKKKSNESKKKDESKSYYYGSSTLSKSLVDTFYINNDIVEIIKIKNKTAKNIINIDSFVEELINNKEFVLSLTNLLKGCINKHIDPNLYVEIKEFSATFIYSSYIRAYKNVYNDFLSREIKMRQKVN